MSQAADNQPRVTPVYARIYKFAQENPEATEYVITTRDECTNLLREMMASMIDKAADAALPQMRNEINLEVGKMRGLLTQGIPEKYFRVNDQLTFAGLKIVVWEDLEDYAETILTS